MLRFKKDSLLCSRLKSDIKKQKAEEFLKAYDDEILNYIELRINEWIKNKIIKSCDVHLVSFIIYKAYVALLVEYDEDIDEKKITKEITLILKDGLFN